MHAIEFEATAHQHTIRLPDSVPDGVPLRVLLLSQAPLAPTPDRNLKPLLASVTEGMSEADIARPHDLGRETPEWAS
ncbi:MAG: hypothetical protein A2063_07485 [Gallionellales bacterium GWA2_60_142]|nr:MAG: hypothetical protein A2063_07485 [Gallionellales bacterium GWA2_60_142]HCI13599.1 hypothetical protein [Gallionellaceae bacterium]